VKAVLGIQQVLATATSEGDPAFDSRFAHYLDILDSVRDEDGPEKNNGSSGPPRASRSDETEDLQMRDIRKES